MNKSLTKLLLVTLAGASVCGLAQNNCFAESVSGTKGSLVVVEEQKFDSKSSLESRIKELKEKLASKREEYGKFEEKRIKVTHSLDNAKKLLGFLESEKSLCENNLKDCTFSDTFKKMELRNTISYLDGRIKSTKDNVSCLEMDTAILKSSIPEYENEIEILSGYILRLEEKLEHFDEQN